MLKRTPRLIAFLNSYSLGKSGGDVVFIETAKRLRQYDVTIITSLQGKKMCEADGIRATYFITSSEQVFNNIFLTYLKRTLKAFFLQNSLIGGDVIVSSSDFFPDVFPALLLKLRYPKSKWVTYVFHIIPSSRRGSHLLQKLSLFLIRHFANKIIVDNTLLKHELVDLNFKLSRITIEYPTIDFAALQSMKINKQKGCDGIFIGQIRRSKGISELIDIWRLVVEKIPSATLDIIGAGDKTYISELKSQVKKAGIEKHVTFWGFLDDATAFPMIKAAKIFVFPSFEEGFGIAAHQAQALGVPVVGWNLPVFAETFSKGMLTTQVGDKQEFCTSIVKLLRNDTMRQKLAKGAIENARQFDKKNEKKPVSD